MNPALYTVQGSCSSLKAVMLAVQSLQLGDTRYTSPIPIDNPHQSRHYVYIRMEGISGGTTLQLVSFILRPETSVSKMYIGDHKASFKKLVF